MQVREYTRRELEKEYVAFVEKIRDEIEEALVLINDGNWRQCSKTLETILSDVDNRLDDEFLIIED